MTISKFASLFTLLAFLTPIVVTQIVQCSRVVTVDSTNESIGQWNGSLYLFTDEDLSGIYIRLKFDKNASQLSNWFGEVTTLDQKAFLIENYQRKQKANTTLILPFFIDYEKQAAAPSVEQVWLNGKTVCNKANPSLEMEECGTVARFPNPLITYGPEVRVGEYPWHAAIYLKKNSAFSYACGASLITLHYFVTVAQCALSRNSEFPGQADTIAIYLGKYYLKKGWSDTGIQRREVSHVIPHSDFTNITFANNIALLKLAKPAEYTDYVRPICLWTGSADQNQIVGKVGTVVGWGVDVSDILSAVEMPVVSKKTCLDSYNAFFTMYALPNTFCAGYRNGTSVCNGDSGGGLFFLNSNRYYLRGVVSLGVSKSRTCDSNHYIVFTDVAQYLDWIKSVIFK